MRVLMIDDIRDLSKGTIARDYFTGIWLLENLPPFDVLELDHDLDSFDEAGKEWTGYHVMCWLEEHPWKLPGRIVCISSNPAGRKNIQQVIDKLYNIENHIIEAVKNETDTPDMLVGHFGCVFPKLISEKDLRNLIARMIEKGVFTVDDECRMHVKE